MKKGVTPSNYKDLVQKRLVADIFKNSWSATTRRVVISLIQYYNKTAIQRGGRRDSAVTFADICVDINTSRKNCNTKAEDTGILDTASNRPLHFAKNYWDTVEDSTVIRQASTVKVVPPPNSLPAATVPIPTTSGPTALSSGTSQNFNIFNMASNLKFDKFKGDNTQNVDTWLSMYKQYCSFYDLSDQ